MMIFLLSVICVVATAVPINNDSQLVSVVVLFRHGDRVPREFAPLDPYGNSSFWPTERGELTNLGIQQMYELGQWLRKRYTDYLPAKYTKRDIYVTSSSVDRCLMSAEVTLAGIYPPVSDQIWNKNLLWRPIPVYSVPKKEDFLFEMANSCPQYVQAYDELLDLEQFRKIDAANSNFYNYLGSHLGVNITSFTDIAEWYDTMREEDVKGLKLPDWTKKVYPTEMQKWSNLSYQVPTYNQQLARYATGTFFDTVCTHFNAVIENSSSSLADKVVMFSGHQTNIADVSNTLGAFRLSPYGGALIFELRKDPRSSSFYLNTMFKTKDELESLKIENCNVDCDLKEFLKIVEPLRVNRTQIEVECEI